MNDVEHPGRQTGLLEKLRAEHRRGGVLLRWLEDEGVPGGDRQRVHPHRDHRREVEGGDAGHDSERLAHREGVDAGRNLLAEFTLDHVGDVAGELDDLQPTLHLAEGIGSGLAVLGGDQLGDLMPILDHEFPVGEHDVLATGDRRVSPGRESLEAAATAASTTSAVAKATSFWTAPVAGS